MKIFNIILSVFIFLLAAASAVFSYFLFEKRAQFVRGHEKMAAAIYESSKALDAGSGTEEAKKLDKNALAHDKYADLDNVLPVLPKQSKNIIKQRDDMAGALWRIGGTVGMKNAGDIESFKMVDGYDARLSAVGKSVADTVNRRDNAYKALAAVARNYRVNINPAALVNAADMRATGNALLPLANFIKTAVSNRDQYRRGLEDVARIAGTRTAVSDANPAAGVKNVQNVVTTKVREVNSLRNELAKVKRENNRLISTVRSKDAQIKAANKKYVEVSNSLSELKESIGVAKDYKPWKAGSIEARSRLFGRVTGVSKEYGYVVIDLGERSVVYQESNGKKLPIRLNLTSGLELVVIRGTEENSDPKAWLNPNGSALNSVELAGKDEFVASTRIVKVGEKELVADLPAGTDIRVGDVVLFKYDEK